MEISAGTGPVKTGNSPADIYKKKFLSQFFRIFVWKRLKNTLSIYLYRPFPNYRQCKLIIKFEDELRPLKGSISTIYEFHYQQKLKQEEISGNLDQIIDMKAPHVGRLYVAILHTDDNTIKILVEINQSDLSLLGQTIH
ncbi:unnamed protein product [Adineta ricciae]|uniref:Uncharacterized protein n=1 Tax=Adineta ricciae TaxID=249248 RepID=A0A815WZ85_ADIRI|nr:unnamed protein product [Adineta ricciae]